MRAQIVAILAALGTCAGDNLAAAVEYEARIDVTNEEDLYELEVTDQITPDTFTALLELMHDGVDLDAADSQRLYALPGLTWADAEAIVGYRKEHGHVTAQHLLVAGLIDEEQLVEIRPFLVSHAGESDFGGWVRGEAAWSPDDDRAPPAALQVRIRAPHGLTFGADLVETQNRIGEVTWDPTRGALLAEGPATRLQVPKLYALWQSANLDTLAGSFRAGFGQRLVFDDTDQFTPNGFGPDDTLFHAQDLVRSCAESQGELAAAPCPQNLQRYVTPDLHWRDGLFGLAAEAKHIPVGEGWLQLVAFVSNQLHSIYQYEIYDRSHCADPHDDANPACAAPAVFRAQPDPAAPTSQLTFETLPDLWREPLAGGNVSWFADRRTHVGFTGYGARPDWLVDGANLDFQEWSRFPYGGAYGAVGGDAAYGVDWMDLSLEIGRSFDSMDQGGGGWGVITRDTATWPHHELELAFRYYARSFANPYAGSISEPDEVDGQRARDEVGPRVRYSGTIGRFMVRALVDFWVQPSLGIPKLLLTARADYRIGAGWIAGLWATVEDKDLGTTGRGQCFSGSLDTIDETNAQGEPIPCKGEEIKTTAMMRVDPVRKLSLAAEFTHVFVDDPKYTDRFRQDVAAIVTATWWPLDSLRIYTRTKYLNQAIDDNAYLEQSLWTYVELTYQRARSWDVRLRYDLYVYLDDRASTLARDPNPEHRLRVEMEARF